MRKESEKIERIFNSSGKLREFVELNFDGTRANDYKQKSMVGIFLKELIFTCPNEILFHFPTFQPRWRSN
jgi:hypothetical protein